ncbi:MAG: type II secretion system protein, partial [Candidatus Acidiferrales bacterium]
HALSWPMTLETTQRSTVRGVSVKNGETKSMTTHRRGNPERGFSMIELCVVIGIIMILSATALFQLGPALQAQRADTAMRQVVEQLRSARELAIANRRWVQVTFPVGIVNGVNENQILITQKNSLTLGAGADAAQLAVPIQRPMAFYVFPGPVPDTPDAFGNASAIEFGGIANGPVGGMYFNSNGEMVNGTTLLPMNGTVFIGVAGKPTTARAVTVMGTTGRIRGWTGNGTAWKQF